MDKRRCSCLGSGGLRGGWGVGLGEGGGLSQAGGSPGVTAKSHKAPAAFVLPPLSAGIKSLIVAVKRRQTGDDSFY